MLCLKKCPRKLKNCKPLSNIAPQDRRSFVCVGLHKDDKKKYPQDKFRHCFKSEDSDSMFDYDKYDMKSVIAVFSEALLIDELEKHIND